MRVFNARRGAGRAIRLVGLATLAALILAACATRGDDYPTSDGNLPGFTPGNVVTEQGRAAADLYLPVFLIAVAVFLLVEGLLIIIAIRFRRKRDDSTLPGQTHGNNLLEIVWTLIPALVVMGMFVVSTSVLVRTEAMSDEPGVTVDVTGFQWQWTFEYKDQGLKFTGAGKNGPEMVLPVDEEVRVRLHSVDVIHSFYVPQFFFKKDVVPGRVNEFPMTIEEPGTYGGQCAEFCGLSHADMYFTVRAVERAEYDQWVATEQQAAHETPPPAPSAEATVDLTSIGIVEGFDPTELTVPADVPFAVAFVNADQTVQHDFGIKDGFDYNGEPDVPAGQTGIYNVPPIPAGTYTFFCTIHPNMTGTLTVGP